MSEEEKKAIEFKVMSLEEQTDYDISNHINEIVEKVIKQRYKDEELEILKIVIEKQAKEIEELQVLADDIKLHRIVYIDTPEFEKNYIPKQKIKDKIKKLKILAEKSDDETLNCCELDIRKNQIYLLQNLLQE